MDESTLRRLYLDEGLSQNQVANELETNRYQVRKHIRKYNIPTHTHGGRPKDAPWHDEETLKDLYYGKNMSLKEVADELGVTQNAIKCEMERFGLERRKPGHSGPHLLTNGGYEVWSVRFNGNPTKVQHHRLLCAAYYGVDSLKGKHVHHKNEIPWDNRIDNLELMTPSEHMQHHRNYETTETK